MPANDRPCWRRYIGLIPGDATAELPEELPELSPASSASERTLIDLATISQEDLMAMSKQSAESPLGAMLPNPPGVLVHREAHMTGMLLSCPGQVFWKYPLLCEMKMQ